MTQLGPQAEATRRRILDAAIGLLAEQSFDVVSLRAIARQAKVDPSLVVHYFGSKEGLFRAIVEAQLRPAEVLAPLASVPVDELGERLVRTVDALWSSPEGRGMLAVVRRMLSSGTDVLPDAVTEQVLGRVLPLVPGDNEAERWLRLSLVASQMSGMLLTRHVLGLEPLASLTSDELADAMGPTFQRYLTGDVGGAS